MVVGLQHVRVVKTLAAHEYAFQPADLQAAIQEDLKAGLIPFYVCTTIGTTSSCAGEEGLVPFHV